MSLTHVDGYIKGSNKMNKILLEKLLMMKSFYVPLVFIFLSKTMKLNVILFILSLILMMNYITLSGLFLILILYISGFFIFFYYMSVFSMQVTTNLWVFLLLLMYCFFNMFYAHGNFSNLMNMSNIQFDMFNWNFLILLLIECLIVVSILFMNQKSFRSD